MGAAHSMEGAQAKAFLSYKLPWERASSLGFLLSRTPTSSIQKHKLRAWLRRGMGKQK